MRVPGTGPIFKLSGVLLPMVGYGTHVVSTAVCPIRMRHANTETSGDLMGRLRGGISTQAADRLKTTSWHTIGRVLTLDNPPRHTGLAEHEPNSLPSGAKAHRVADVGICVRIRQISTASGARKTPPCCQLSLRRTIRSPPVSGRLRCAAARAAPLSGSGCACRGGAAAGEAASLPLAAALLLCCPMSRVPNYSAPGGVR